MKSKSSVKRVPLEKPKIYPPIFTLSLFNPRNQIPFPNILFSPMSTRFFRTSLFRSAIFHTKIPKSKSIQPIPQTPTFFSSISVMGDARRPLFAAIPSPDKADRSELLRSLEFSLKSSFSSDPLVPISSPLIVVISGPSGVGKDAVIKRLREVREGLHFVVTATTRPIRPGEVDGQDYHFVSKEDFLAMIERNELLEYALVYGDYKGIPKGQIREFMAKGYDVVLRVDIQGAETLRKILGNSAVFVFLMAESEVKLVERLIDRKTETKESLLVRVAMAREEVKHVHDFDYVVVNAEGKLESAVKLVESIIDAEKAKVVQRHASV